MEKVKIDPQKIRGFAKSEGKTLSQLSYEIGKSANYLSTCMCNGEMPEGTYRIFCQLHGVKTDRFIPDPPKPAPVEQPKMVNQLDLPYTTELKIFPDRVRFTIFYKGQPIYSAFSYIKGKTETDLMQAISYAAHMCYKLAEQKKLHGGVKNA